MTDVLDAPADPDSALFPSEPTVVIVIGTERCEVLPLNLHGLKAVLRAVKDCVQPLTAGYSEFQRSVKAWEADNAHPPPDVMWWFPIVTDDIDNVYLAVLEVLKRGNRKLTFAYLEDNLDPFIHLPVIWTAFVGANNLGTLAKKLMTSEAGSLFQSFLKQRAASNSPTSSSISPTTTESASTS